MVDVFPLRYTGTFYDALVHWSGDEGVLSELVHFGEDKLEE